ncbi:uncharacterized protein LOC122614517 [Drosophila teissieri]|uniref:uncharacterized protein LOC122614517 n=1 Tax=Drosophila teissieri TaxID=7243 RepID=UPI001CB9F723|nr:uncharacterized protein LOC122614517 [Drosophila teissieri]
MQTLFALILMLTVLQSHVDSSRFLDNSCEDPISKQMVSNSVRDQRAAWLASITNATQFLCTGSLIHKQYVLSAAKCMDVHGQLFVRLGAYTSTESHNLYTVIGVFFPHSEKQPQSDIGLLKLSRSVDYNDLIYPICIIINGKTSGQPYFKTSAWLSKLKTSRTIILHKVSDDLCQLNSTENMCAAAGSYRKSCRIDSGSPLTYTVVLGSSITREVLFGIRSYGNGEKSCSEAAHYINVAQYVGWIETVVTNNGKNDLMVAPQKVEQPVQHTQSAIRCDGGDSLSTKLRARIYGPNYIAQGWFITDRYVITNAKGLPTSAASLNVGLPGTTRSYDEFNVQSVVKHPQFSEDYKNDIALLRIDPPVAIGNLRPICMLLKEKHREMAKSNPPVTFNYVQTADRIEILRENATLLDSSVCSNRLQKTVEANQICVQTPFETGQNSATRGGLLGLRMMYEAKEWLALLGILSYSQDGLEVFTDVMAHTQWIAEVVNSDQQLKLNVPDQHTNS